MFYLVLAFESARFACDARSWMTSDVNEWISVACFGEWMCSVVDY